MPDLTVTLPDQRTRADIIPAEPGWRVHLLNPRTAREAGAPPVETHPVVAWVTYWYEPEDRSDSGHVTYTAPLFIDPATPDDWNSDYDYGAGTTPIDLNYGRAADDQFKWKVDFRAR